MELPFFYGVLVEKQRTLGYMLDRQKLPRKHPRRPVRLATPVLDTRSGQFFTGRSRDLSFGGIYVETAAPPPLGVIVEMFIGGLGVGTQVIGRVVHHDSGKGFGATFTEDDTSKLRDLLHEQIDDGEVGADQLS